MQVEYASFRHVFNDGLTPSVFSDCRLDPIHAFQCNVWMRGKNKTGNTDNISIRCQINNLIQTLA